MTSVIVSSYNAQDSWWIQKCKTRPGGSLLVFLLFRIKRPSLPTNIFLENSLFLNCLGFWWKIKKSIFLFFRNQKQLITKTILFWPKSKHKLKIFEKIYFFNLSGKISTIFRSSLLKKQSRVPMSFYLPVSQNAYSSLKHPSILLFSCTASFINILTFI